MKVMIRVAGEAGQGVATTGRLLVEAFAHIGLAVGAVQSYMSRVRGGLNWYDVRVGAEPVHGGADKADILVALTPAAREALAGEVREGGLVLFNGADGESVIAVDFDAVAEQTGGKKIYSNTVAAGAVMELLGYDVGKLADLLSEAFAKKGDEVVAANVRCVHKGAELVRGQSGRIEAPQPSAGASAGRVYNGAEAIGLSAAVSGVKFAAAYPMTPGAATFAYLAGVAERYGIVVEQAEDEIAAVNMICGAAYAGVPALTSTSGGGFALMVEGVSLAGIMELPICIVVAQRPGPATGLPTRTAQQDLLFALHGGHGEFPKAIYAPGSVRQCYDVTRRAIETAHRFQIPVMILTDQFLQDFEQTIEPLSDEYDPVDRCIVSGGPDYVRYAVTESGVSPRALPGGEALVICDSDEHTEAGHLTEDLNVHVAQQDKRMRKLEGLTAEAIGPESYGPDGAETLLVCWGSTYGSCREAVDLLNRRGGSVAMLHFAQVWPIAHHAAAGALQGRQRIVCVEGNQTGHFAQLLRTEGLIGDVENLGRYDGMPFTGEWIAERIGR